MILSTRKGAQSMKSKYLSIDIGASSGRAIVIIVDKEKIQIDEVYRFLNETLFIDDKLYWNFNQLIAEVKKGILLSYEKYPDLKSIGIDTWGVDYGLIDFDGNLIGQPRCYRDDRNHQAKAQFHQVYDSKLLYRSTGIQQLPFNTIYQLFDDYSNKELFNQTKHILLLPNLIGYFLTGQIATELTNASTTSMLNANTKTWISEPSIIQAFTSKFPNLVKPATMLGTLNSIPGLPPVPVINICSHDTASAFVSTRLSEEQVLISSGTWSLIGTNLSKPNLSEASMDLNFTNELGMNHQTRFLKNVMGMWILNETKKSLELNQKSLSFFDIEKKAISSKPMTAFIDPDDAIFMGPGHMIDKIHKFLEETNQRIPKTEGELLRIIYESYAFKYRYTIDNMQKILKKPLTEIIIIGGGNQSKFLNQMTANYTKRKVITGAKEATVLGNGLVQMLYFKDIKTIKKGQTMIQKSFENHTYEANYCVDCDEGYERFLSIIEKRSQQQ